MKSFSIAIGNPTVLFLGDSNKYAAQLFVFVLINLLTSPSCFYSRVFKIFELDFHSFDSVFVIAEFFYHGFDHLLTLKHPFCPVLFGIVTILVRAYPKYLAFLQFQNETISCKSKRNIGHDGKSHSHRHRDAPLAFSPAEGCLSIENGTS